MMCDHSKRPKLFCLSQQCSGVECFACAQCIKLLHNHSGKELFIEQKQIALLINRFEPSSRKQQQHKSCNIKIYKLLMKIKTELTNKMDQIISDIMSKIKYPYLFQYQLLDSYRQIRDKNYQRIHPKKLRQFYKATKMLSESQFLLKQQQYYNHYLNQTQQSLSKLQQKITIIEATFQFKIHPDVVRMQKECIAQIMNHKDKVQNDKPKINQNYYYQKGKNLSAKSKQNFVKMQLLTPVKSKNQLDISLDNLSYKSPSGDLQKSRRNSVNQSLSGQKDILPRSFQIIQQNNSRLTNKSSGNSQVPQKNKLINFFEVKTTKSFKESSLQSKKNTEQEKQPILNKNLALSTYISTNTYTYSQQSQNHLYIKINDIKTQAKHVENPLSQLSKKVSQIKSETTKKQQQRLKKWQLQQKILTAIKQKQKQIERENNISKNSNHQNKQKDYNQDKYIQQQSKGYLFQNQGSKTNKFNTTSQIINKQKQTSNQNKNEQKRQGCLKTNNQSSLTQKIEGHKIKSPRLSQEGTYKSKAYSNGNSTLTVNQQRHINRQIDNLSISKHVFLGKQQKSKGDLSISNNISNTKEIPIIDSALQISSKKSKVHKKTKSIITSPEDQLEAACVYYLKMTKLQDMQKTQNFLQRYNQKYQNNITAAQYLTYTYLQAGKAKQCLNICNKYLQKLQTLPISQSYKLNLIINKAAALNMLSRQNQAIPYLLQKLKLIQHEKIHKNIGDAYYNINLRNKAVYHYERAIIINNKYDEAFYNLAVILYTQESYFNAKMNIDKAIACQPCNQQYQQLLTVIEERIDMNSDI